MASADVAIAAARPRGPALNPVAIASSISLVQASRERLEGGGLGHVDPSCWTARKMSSASAQLAALYRMWDGVAPPPCDSSWSRSGTWSRSMLRSLATDSREVPRHAGQVMSRTASGQANHGSFKASKMLLKRGGLLPQTAARTWSRYIDWNWLPKMASRTVAGMPWIAWAGIFSTCSGPSSGMASCAIHSIDCWGIDPNSDAVKCFRSRPSLATVLPLHRLGAAIGVPEGAPTSPRARWSIAASSAAVHAATLSSSSMAPGNMTSLGTCSKPVFLSTAYVMLPISTTVSAIQSPGVPSRAASVDPSEVLVLRRKVAMLEAMAWPVIEAVAAP